MTINQLKRETTKLPTVKTKTKYGVEYEIYFTSRPSGKYGNMIYISEAYHNGVYTDNLTYSKMYDSEKKWRAAYNRYAKKLTQGN